MIRLSLSSGKGLNSLEPILRVPRIGILCGDRYTIAPPIPVKSTRHRTRAIWSDSSALEAMRSQAAIWYRSRMHETQLELSCDGEKGKETEK